MIRHTKANSTPLHETSQQKPETWRHPGGKLVELGSHVLKQDELLAILIGAGVPGHSAITIANAVLDEYVGLFGIHRPATLEDLAHIPGLGTRKASRILSAVELGRRLNRLTHPPKTVNNAENYLFSSTQPPPQSEQPTVEEPSDADLLAEIIGSGIRGRTPKTIAEDLLAQFGSFIDLFGQDMGDFERIKGLNSVKIIRIAAALEVAKRIDQALS